MKHPERLSVEEIEARRPWNSGIGAGCLPLLCIACICVLLGLAHIADRW